MAQNRTVTGPGQIFPTECVLCDYSGDSPEAFEQHMAEVHD